MKKKATLIVGVDGAIGSNIANFYRIIESSFWQTTRRDSRIGDRCLFLDLSMSKSFESLPLKEINEVIICAGINSDERCRMEPEHSRKVNIVNTVALAQHLVDAGIFVVFFSSTTVFDGQTAFPKPTDHTCPHTEYGWQKAEAEKKLLSLGDRIAILRIGKVVTQSMPLVKNWIYNLEKGKEIHPFWDMVTSPMSFEFLIKVIQKITLKQLSGVIHVTANGDVSYADIAFYLSRVMCYDQNLIQPISFREAGILSSPKHVALNSSGLREIGLESPDPMEAFEQFALKKA